MDVFSDMATFGMGLSFITLLLDIILRIVILYLLFLSIKALKLYIKERK